jgi:type II secretory pathway pseudopilin PulG
LVKAICSNRCGFEVAKRRKKGILFRNIQVPELVFGGSGDNSGNKWGACDMRRGKTKKRRMTLLEVLIAVFVSALVIGGVMMSIVMATESTLAATQETAAMQLCMELAEELRSRPFEDLDPDSAEENFPQENGLTLHAPQIGDNTVTCNRSVTIANADDGDIEGRRIVVTVAWNNRGMARTTSYETIIYRMED